MLTVGGLILGAVLTAPGATNTPAPRGAEADTFAPAGPLALARHDRALGLREPFEAPVSMPRRRPQGRVDLREPFDPGAQMSVAAPAPPVATDLRSPFVIAPSASVTRPALRARGDLREPFARERPARP